MFSTAGTVISVHSVNDLGLTRVSISAPGVYPTAVLFLQTRDELLLF